MTNQTEVAPTDDEREALWEDYAVTVEGVRKATATQANLLHRTWVDGFAAGFRRTVQSEPTPEEWRASIVDERCQQLTKGYNADHDREHGIDHLLVWAQDYARRGEPLKSAALVEAARELLAQREPAEANVDAAIAAYKESARMHPGREHMRAALRAAFNEAGEGR